MQKTTIGNDVEIEYVQSGNGSDVLLFIHGLGSNYKAFNKLTPQLEEEYTTVAINLPQDLDSFSLKSYAQFINEFINKKKYKNVSLVGHSMGAQIAMHYALMYSESIEKLFLICPAGIETFSETDRAWFGKYVNKAFYKSYTPEKVKFNFDINFYGSKLPEDAYFMYEERIEIMSDSMSYDKYLDYYLGSINAMLKEPVYDELHKLKKETIVIFGKDDLLIPNRILHPQLTTSQLIENVKGKLTNAQCYELESCGHFAVWDKPKEIADIIKTIN